MMMMRWVSIPGLLALLVPVGVSALSGCKDPFAVDPPADCEQVVQQNQFVLDVMHGYYLWHKDLADAEAEAYESPGMLVRALRVPPDKWSDVYSKPSVDDLFKRGKVHALGYLTVSVGSGDQKQQFISFVHPGSPAARAGLRRGDEILAVRDPMPEGEAMASEAVVVSVVPRGSSASEAQDVMVAKEDFVIPPVPLHTVLDAPVEGLGRVGYLAFTTFVEPSKAALDEAFAAFHEAGVDEVVVDLRYNRGGLLSIAEHLIDLLVGRRFDKKLAYRISYNENLSKENYAYHLHKQSHSLDVDRVVFLTGRDTVSASELVINALRPYVDVATVGASTGGKPVGMNTWDFCDKTVFPITFQLVNADKEGDYFDGIVPTCPVVDDLTHDLGDPDEAIFAAGLTYLATGSCPAAALRDGGDDVFAPVPFRAPVVTPMPHEFEAPTVRDVTF